jgi:5-methyltetrahydropteroyltriglutamate--homocysteine methyltransferase
VLLDSESRNQKREGISLALCLACTNVITTVVGNYPKIPNRPRPARLRNAYNRLDRGEITREDVKKVEDEVTIEAMQEQARAGIDLVTDGQVRWQDEQTYIMGGLAGVRITGLIRFFDTNTYYRQPVIEGPIAWKSAITVRDYEFAKANSERPVKPVLTGPYTLARLSLDTHYGNLEDVVLAIAEALNEEAKALQAAGARIVQFNEPALTKHTEDAPLAQKAWRRLLDGVSGEPTVYFYFGSPNGAVAAAVAAGFQTVGVDLTLPEAQDKLKKGVPLPEKLAVGVVDSRNTRLEDLDVVVSRIRAAAALVPAERLYVNPNMGLEFLPREEAEAKLVRMVEGVKKAKESLQ